MNEDNEPIDYEINGLVEAIKSAIKHQCEEGGMSERKRVDATYDAITICLRDVIAELCERPKDE